MVAFQKVQIIARKDMAIFDSLAADGLAVDADLAARYGLTARGFIVAGNHAKPKKVFHENKTKNPRSALTFGFEFEPNKSGRLTSYSPCTSNPKVKSSRWITFIRCRNMEYSNF